MKLQNNCDNTSLLMSSSIGGLITDNPGLDLVSGPLSLGAFLEREGCMATPAPQNRVPGKSPQIKFIAILR